MTQNTALTQLPHPTFPAETVRHLIDDHGWEPPVLAEHAVAMHQYAHGAGGRPDLADDDVTHTHTEPARPQSKNRGWKIAFWVWNLLGAFFLIMGIAAGGSAAVECKNDTAAGYVEACQAGAGLGGAALAGGALFITAVGDVVLGVGFIINRKQQTV